VAEVLALRIGIRVPEPPGRRPKNGGRGEHLRQGLERITQRRMEIPRRDVQQLGSRVEGAFVTGMAPHRRSPVAAWLGGDLYV
jgi:hypothetical protein